jgi:hypothetical protein
VVFSGLTNEYRPRSDPIGEGGTSGAGPVDGTVRHATVSRGGGHRYV